MLFETAWAAYEKPVTSSSPTNTSLIPMRECINETIVTLLCRCPGQEPTPNQYAKIISIWSGKKDTELRVFRQRDEPALYVPIDVSRTFSALGIESVTPRVWLSTYSVAL